MAKQVSGSTPAGKGFEEEDYFRGGSGKRYPYAEIADRIRKDAPHTLGKHISEQLEAIGLLEEMQTGTTPCGLPFTFAEADANGPPLPSPGELAREDGPTFQQIRGILAERRQVAILWTVDDVQSVRPDLDEDQAWKVLQQIEHDHDGSFGITWDTIESASQQRFPDPDHLATAEARALPPADGPADKPRLPSPSEILADPRRFLTPEQSNGNGKDNDREM